MSVRTRLNYQSTIDGTITTNGSGDVSGADVNQALKDLSDSAVFPEDGISVNADLNYFEQEDWVISALFGFSTASSGAGTGFSSDNFGVDTTENVIGSFYLTTGTTNTGRISLEKSAQTAVMIFGIAALNLKKRIALHDLSTGGETYTAYIGFGDNVGSGDMANGAYFRYTHGTNSGKWEAVTASASSRTATDTGITADTTFHIFNVVVNQAGTSVAFYIDGTLVATNTTNISTTNPIGHLLKIEKSAGTTARKIYEDWYSFLITRTSAR